jgi:hypothetical protein
MLWCGLLRALFPKFGLAAVRSTQVTSANLIHRAFVINFTHLGIYIFTQFHPQIDWHLHGWGILATSLISFPLDFNQIWKCLFHNLSQANAQNYSFLPIILLKFFTILDCTDSICPAPRPQRAPATTQPLRLICLARGPIGALALLRRCHLQKLSVKSAFSLIDQGMS